MKKDLKGVGKFFLFGCILVFLDQLTKILFTYKYIDFGFFAINYVRNFGISFGLFQGINNFIIIISFLALGFIYYYRAEFKDSPFLLTMILSGILGNLIDRIRVGFVIDFIDFKVWPVFNFADIYLVLGIGLFIFFSYINQKSSKSSSLSK